MRIFRYGSGEAAELPEGLVTSESIEHVEVLTQSEYDALETPDAETLYWISDA